MYMYMYMRQRYHLSRLSEKQQLPTGVGRIRKCANGENERRTDFSTVTHTQAPPPRALGEEPRARKPVYMDMDIHTPEYMFYLYLDMDMDMYTPKYMFYLHACQ